MIVDESSLVPQNYFIFDWLILKNVTTEEVASVNSITNKIAFWKTYLRYFLLKLPQYYYYYATNIKYDKSVSERLTVFNVNLKSNDAGTIADDFDAGCYVTFLLLPKVIDTYIQHLTSKSTVFSPAIRWKSIFWCILPKSINGWILITKSVFYLYYHSPHFHLHRDIGAMSPMPPPWRVTR